MNDEETTSTTLVERIKESPRTVSALIVILIVAAAIYAFSGDQAPSPEPTDEELQIAVNNEEGAVEADQEAATDEAGEADEPAATGGQEVTREELAQESAELPEPTTTGTAYVEVAQAGDGVTHLARRAATRWLSENDAGYTVTNEHRIYIEDYIQNRLGNQPLTLGAQHEVSFDLVAEAVRAAGELNASQLSNLSQYTHALNS